MPMKFGVLDDLTGVDFTLPPDNPFNEKTLSIQNNAPLEVYIGPPEWGLKEWVGTVYPKGTKPKDYFEHMAHHFNTVEFNSLFYGIPGLDKIEEWKRKTSGDFRFCPKFPKSITHDKKLVNVEKQTEEFTNAILGFGNNLGRSFLQFSESFQPGALKSLTNYLEYISAIVPVAVELRNEKWYSDKVLWQDTCAIFRSLGVGTIITDTAGRRDAIHMTLTDNMLMLRFHSNDLEPSAYSRIDDWCMKIKQWIAEGLRTIYIFVHTRDNIHVPESAAYWVRKLNEICGLNLKEPEFPDDSPQGSLI